MSEAEPGRGRRGWLRFKAWWMAHHHRLMSIDDSPHAIAMGMAIGIFFGFTPLWSLKTLLSIAVAWLFNSNKIAAAISVTLHDVVLPFMPAIFWWEYKTGYFALHGVSPGRMHIKHIPIGEYLHWKVLANVIWPTFLGSVVLGLPVAVVTYFIARSLVIKASQRRAAAAAETDMA